jgi:hypothetical protein
MGASQSPFSLGTRATGSHVPDRTLHQVDDAWAVNRFPPGLIPGQRHAPVLAPSIRFRQVIERFTLVRLPDSFLAGITLPFPQRSRQRLIGHAAACCCKPAPRGPPGLWYSTALSWEFPPAGSRHRVAGASQREVPAWRRKKAAPSPFPVGTRPVKEECYGEKQRDEPGGQPAAWRHHLIGDPASSSLCSLYSMESISAW